MSRLKAVGVEDGALISIRKRKATSQDLEIDINAPEPPSKKATRNAKRAKLISAPDATSAKEVPGDNNRAKDGAINGRSLYGIWIGNLSFSTTKQELQTFVSSDKEHPIAESEITRIHLPLSSAANRSRPQNKGFAYVDFSTPQAQRNGLQLSEKLLTGRRVLVKSSRDFEGRPEKSQSNGIGSGAVPSKRVFIGNLDFDMTKEGLESHFEACGSIANTQIATFEDSGKCKGYAWIDFEEIASAAAAVRGWVESATANEGAEQTKTPKRRFWVNKIKGRKLRAEFAEDKTTRYNKRFGKHAYSAADTRDGEQASGSPQKNGKALVSQPEFSTPSATEKTGSRGRSDRYDKATLTRLTGAIVGAEGKKTTFE